MASIISRSRQVYIRMEISMFGILSNKKSKILTSGSEGILPLEIKKTAPQKMRGIKTKNK